MIAAACQKAKEISHAPKEGTPKEGTPKEETWPERPRQEAQPEVLADALAQRVEAFLRGEAKSVGRLRGGGGGVGREDTDDTAIHGIDSRRPLYLAPYPRPNSFRRR
jgi:hypothetical protein